MKAYQDPDPLHGHGKAIPQPKRATHWIFRRRYSVVANELRTIRRENAEAVMRKERDDKGKAVKRLSLIGTVAVMLGFQRRH